MLLRVAGSGLEARVFSKVVSVLVIFTFLLAMGPFPISAMLDETLKDDNTHPGHLDLSLLAEGIFDDVSPASKGLQIKEFSLKDSHYQFFYAPTGKKIEKKFQVLVTGHANFLAASIQSADLLSTDAYIRVVSPGGKEYGTNPGTGFNSKPKVFTHGLKDIKETILSGKRIDPAAIINPDKREGFVLASEKKGVLSLLINNPEEGAWDIEVVSESNEIPFFASVALHCDDVVAAILNPDNVQPSGALIKWCIIVVKNTLTILTCFLSALIIAKIKVVGSIATAIKKELLKGIIKESFKAFIGEVLETALNTKFTWLVEFTDIVKEVQKNSKWQKITIKELPGLVVKILNHFYTPLSEIICNWLPGERPTILVESLPRGVVGEKYEAKFYLSNEETPYKWTRKYTIPGLKFKNKKDHLLITGTPKSHGTYTMKLEAKDGTGTKSEKRQIKLEIYHESYKGIKPDIQALQPVVFANTPKRGASIKVGYTIKNKNKMPSEPFEHGLFWSTNKTLDSKDVLLYTGREKNGLGYNQTKTYSPQVEIPMSAIPGKNGFILAVVDIYGETRDNNPGNNKFASVVKVGADPVVTYPKDGTTWTQGKNYNIRWQNFTHFKNGKDWVKLELWQNGKKYTTIDSATYNDNSKDWTVPGNISGTGFQVMVENYNRKSENAFSPGSFTIKESSGGGGGGGSVTILSEGFSYGWPYGKWTREIEGSSSYGWDEQSSVKRSGSYALWCADYPGDKTPDYSNYDANMYTQAKYGPLSLSSYNSGTFSFYYRGVSEYHEDCGYDRFFAGVSIDGENFYGTSFCGNWDNSWNSYSLDFTDLYYLGDVTGRSQVWIVFMFYSDSSNEYKGFFVDDVVIKASTSSAPRQLNSPSKILPGAKMKNEHININNLKRIKASRK